MRGSEGGRNCREDRDGRNEGGETGMGEHEVKEGVKEEGTAGRTGRGEMKEGRQVGESMK